MISSANLEQLVPLMDRLQQQLDAAQESCLVGIRRPGALVVSLLTLMAGCSGPDPGSGGAGGIGGGFIPCEPKCSAVLHKVCDDDAEAPSCVCAPGYAGDPCTWAGVVDDPGFEDQDAWNPSGGALVLPFAPGSIDGGFALVSGSAACNAGQVSQTVQMPSYEAGEPLVAEVTYRAQGLYGLALGFNRAWTTLEPNFDEDWRTERVCLGEAAYGGDVRVQLAAPEEHPSCFDDPQGDIEVDRLDIVLAERDECPEPGEVLNGTGNVGEGGWQFETTGGAVAGLAEGVGRQGSSGVRLFREAGDRAVAWTKLSVPSSESLPSPALRFWWRGTALLPFKFQIGRYDQIGSGAAALPLDDVYGNGSALTYQYCLPPWTHGNVVDLAFRPLVDSLSGNGPSELVIDEVEIVSDARCGTSTDVLDPGFDAGPARIMGVTHFTPYSSAALRTERSLSRTGDGGVLELSYWSEQAVIWFETWVLVPESNGDEGPAVRFWWNIPTESVKPVRSVLGRAAVEPRLLPAIGGWEQTEPICIPPEWSGRWFRFQWRVGDFPAIGTAPVDPPIRIYIDDLKLTTSSACPSD